MNSCALGILTPQLMNSVRRGGESPVCTSFVHHFLGLKSEARVGESLGGDDLPRVTIVWNPFPDSVLFLVCFSLLRPPRARSVERGGGKRKLVNT